VKFSITTCDEVIIWPSSTSVMPHYIFLCDEPFFFSVRQSGGIVEWRGLQWLCTRLREKSEILSGAYSIYVFHFVYLWFGSDD
jgi:hypothetical protein